MALADLIGIGLSFPEALKAVMIVSNRIFDRRFKLPGDEHAENIDIDTLPTKKALRQKTEKVEAHGLAAEVPVAMSLRTQQIQKRRGELGSLMFQVSMSIGNFVLPLPTIPVAGEAKEEIAEQAALGFQILAAASGKDPSELYRSVELHMTDSTGYNKFLSEVVQVS